MSVALIRPTVIDRRYKSIIERFGLKSSSVALRTSCVSAITAEQDAHVHLISFALEPPEKAAYAVPAIVVVIIVSNAVAALLAVDDKLLVGFREFLEWNANVDLFPGTGAQQIFL
jgi:hypothetical protein